MMWFSWHWEVLLMFLRSCGNSYRYLCGTKTPSPAERVGRRLIRPKTHELPTISWPFGPLDLAILGHIWLVFPELS